MTMQKVDVFIVFVADSNDRAYDIKPIVCYGSKETQDHVIHALKDWFSEVLNELDKDHILMMCEDAKDANETETESYANRRAYASITYAMTVDKEVI